VKAVLGIKEEGNLHPTLERKYSAWEEEGRKNQKSGDRS